MMETEHKYQGQVEDLKFCLFTSEKQNNGMKLLQGRWRTRGRKTCCTHVRLTGFSAITNLTGNISHLRGSRKDCEMLIVPHHS